MRDATGQPAVVGATEIVLRDTWFHPPVSRVPVGTTVTFTWQDGSAVHDVAFADGVASEVIAEGTWQRSFDRAGTFDYRCTLHPFMDGRIEVVD